MSDPRTTASPALPPPSVAARVALAAVVIVGAALRLRAVGHGLSPEEVSDVEHGDLGFFLRGGEVGVNPPLLRLALNGLFECRATLVAGRVLSAVCGTVAPLLVFGVARRAARGWTPAGLLAATLVATLPMGVETSAEFRAYAPFTACAAGLLLASTAWRAATTPAARRGHAVAFAALAVLLPQLHYIGVPLLLGLGAALLVDRAGRPLLAGLVASAAAFAPLAWIATGTTGFRATDPHNLREGLLAVTSLDLSLPGDLVSWTVERGWLDGWHDAERAGIATFVVGSLVLAASAWRWLDATQRALLGACVGVLAGVATFALEHRVRSPVATALLVVYAPLIASLPARLPSPGRALAAVALVGPLAGATVDKWSRGTDPTERDALQWLAHHVHDLDAVRDGAPIVLLPGITHTTLHFYWVGHSWGPHAPATACPGDPDCFQLDGMRVSSSDAWPAPGTDALVVALREPGPDEGAGCTPVRPWPPAIWRCGR